MKQKTFTTKIDNTEIKVTISDLAEKANGSVLIEAGGTVVLVTAVMSDHEAHKDYFPLSVEFEERFYSVGAILGSRFMRREGRPSQEATLNARLIDRTIRPLFPKGFYREVQIISTVISFSEYNPDVLALLGTSIALGVSDIPWNGPVSGIRFSRVNGEWTPFPLFEASRDTETVVLCGKSDVITMLEMEGREVPEEAINDVAHKASSYIEKLQLFQNGIIEEVGKPKLPFEKTEVPAQLKDMFEKDIRQDLTDALFSSTTSVSDVQKKWSDLISQASVSSAEGRACQDYFEDVADDIVHTKAVEEKKRCDGRKLDEVRSLFAQAGGVSPRLHGSGIFYRGGTHVFTALTLGGPSDALLLNTIEDPESNEHFMHHYNFPPFSTGEVGRVGSPKRRELGHGALAEKAIRYVLPSMNDFPYTIRLVSECLSSNGSTSMASTCASTIALLDGGVPISAPVAGIAIGLMQKGDSYVLLTDIQGPEDHHGDMDFKVAGTVKGVTAIQMDVKVEGITYPMLSEILERARLARLHILKTIEEAIPETRSSLSPFAPRIKKFIIDPSDIGLVIGPGGKTIKALRAETSVDSIDIEDDGTIIIAGGAEQVESAYQKIYTMTKKIEVGDLAEVTIKNITDFGAFAEISPGKDGLIHISELTPGRINRVEDVLSVGDVVPVVVDEVREDGRISLSVKKRDKNFFNKNTLPTPYPE